jgi:hypothetical protein
LIGDIRFDEFEARIALQVPQVLPPSGEKAVDTNNVEAIRGEDVAKVGAEEPGPPATTTVLCLPFLTRIPSL